MSRDPGKSFIVDASVLIDYCQSDLSIFSKLSQHVGIVHIARSTFDKVEELTETEAGKHHLVIDTPDIDTLIEASAKRGKLAYDDRETMLLAKKNGWTCITNDKALREECRVEGVACLWGLEPMKLLVGYAMISGSAAVAVARKIRATNGLFITSAIVGRFERQIEEIEAKRRGGN